MCINYFNDLKQLNVEKWIDIYINDLYHINNSYFLPKIKPFVNKEWYEKKEKECCLTEDFYKQRKEGESERYILVLIRKDSVDDFIVYVNKNQIQLDSEIHLSFHDTNNFLLKNFNLTPIK